MLIYTVDVNSGVIESQMSLSILFANFPYRSHQSCAARARKNLEKQDDGKSGRQQAYKVEALSCCKEIWQLNHIHMAAGFPDDKDVISGIIF